jgi:putative ABC transport system ATP-binding protein
MSTPNQSSSGLDAKSSNPTSPLLQIVNLNRYFFTDEIETRALHEINLTINNRDFISIEGPSGSGKSTLLSIIGLLDTPTSGIYEFKGIPVHALSRNERSDIRNREIGFVFQSFNLIGDMSVLKNVELPLRYRNISAKERKQRAFEALKKVAMSHRARHFPSQLSGGQQQRVAVARAIVGNPGIILADEPTGNLDSENGEAVMTLLKQINTDGATICMVTHDERYRNYASRTVALFDGTMVSPA